MGCMGSLGGCDVGVAGSLSVGAKVGTVFHLSETEDVVNGRVEQIGHVPKPVRKGIAEG